MRAGESFNIFSNAVLLFQSRDRTARQSIEHQHWTWSVMQDSVGHAAKDKAPYTMPAS
jgi:hypothetical protein